jgi:flagellar basal body-associated protein FliL
MALKDDVNDIKKEVKNVKELNKQSLAKEMLEDYKKQNKRLFIIIIIILCMWFATGCYLVYILNDTGVIEETTTTQEVTQDNKNGTNNFIGNNGDINNGETNDKADKNKK